MNLMSVYGNFTKKAGEYLVGYSRGYYGDAGDVAERMRIYADENALRLIGPVFTMFLHEEICTKDPSQYLGQYSVAVAGKRAARNGPDV